MFETSAEYTITFIIISVILILALVVFIAIIILRYQKNQNSYLNNLEELKITHENQLLQSQLEIQEQTFQNISREIHDNIGQKLTLAKLHLNTLNFTYPEKTELQVTDSVNMISEAINDLSDLSRSMSSENILNNGLIKALEFEVAQLKKAGIFQVNFSTTGNPVFLDANTELVLFRIVQEAINNIIKHAVADIIDIELHYNSLLLTIDICDNGKGFNAELNSGGTGLLNMKKRAQMLNGTLHINSFPDIHTRIKIEIPVNDESNTL
jgi:signal transduction histidine kinase